MNKGADVHARNNDGYTPLHWAARMAPETVKYLLDYGADIHARDNHGNTPLHWAAWSGYTQTVELLLARGANIWAQKNYDKTALAWDDTWLLEPHRDEWLPKLEKVKGRDCDEIKTVQDLYYLASVMKPLNPKDIPHPKEFIRTLFLQYIPHKPEFDTLYEAIFAETRPKEFDLQTARKEAVKCEVAR